MKVVLAMEFLIQCVQRKHHGHNVTSIAEKCGKCVFHFFTSIGLKNGCQIEIQAVDSVY